MTEETTPKSVSPEYVAERILWLRPEGETTPMHVLKLVYLCHGWMLGINGIALINEPVEAWIYGPVVPTIYHRYKSFGGDTISTERINREGPFSESQRDIIKDVVSAYKDYTALQLSDITHQKDTPWDFVCRQYGAGSIIPNELINDHYRRLANCDQ